MIAENKMGEHSVKVIHASDMVKNIFEGCGISTIGFEKNVCYTSSYKDLQT